MVFEMEAEVAGTLRAGPTAAAAAVVVDAATWNVCPKRASERPA